MDLRTKGEPGSRRSTSVGTRHALRPAVLSSFADLRHRTAGERESTWRHPRAARALHSGENRMRLVAALLGLATLLLWMLFRQG